MMTLGLLAIVIALMTLWPETSSARWLHRHLVKHPLDLAERATRRQLLTWFILVVMLLSLGEMAALAPMEVLTVIAADTAVYVEALVAVWTIATVTRTKAAARVMFARLPLRRGLGIGARARRRRMRPMAQRKPANDDDGGDDAALAVAA
jgi:hypothetical protein